MRRHGFRAADILFYETRQLHNVMEFSCSVSALLSSGPFLRFRSNFAVLSWDNALLLLSFSHSFFLRKPQTLRRNT